MSFQDTRPAELDAAGGPDPWGEFRVTQAVERLSLLRALRDGNAPVALNTPDGLSMTVVVWAVDAEQGRLNFRVEHNAPQLEELVQADEVVAVAYLENVKLQFDLQGFTLVRGAKSCALQCVLPREIYRFQRRNAYRVRPRGNHGPMAVFRHPALPDMRLALRVLDLSIGGCALWLPPDVPPLQAGTSVAAVHLELDTDASFVATLNLQHLSVLGHGERAAAGEHGARVGCEWQALAPASERVLQRWIDRTQRRRHLLALGPP